MAMQKLVQTFKLGGSRALPELQNQDIWSMISNEQNAADYSGSAHP